MQQITLNFFQIISLIVFIYVFTYYWLPKTDNNTEEYLKLLEKYNKVLNDRKYYKSQYLKVTDEYKKPPITIGKSISAHSGTIQPRNVDQNDNYLVDQIVN